MMVMEHRCIGVIMVFMITLEKMNIIGNIDNDGYDNEGYNDHDVCVLLILYE